MREVLRRAPAEERAHPLRMALDALPDDERDGWLDLVLGVEPFPDDGPDLPAGCVPYLPCPVALLLRMLDEVPLTSDDVFVDIGSGTGRVPTLVHLLTGAVAIGVEVQASLVATARQLTRGLGLERVTTIHADVAEDMGSLSSGTVFFLYCPFSDARLERVLDALEAVAARRSIHVCCVQVPPLARSWLEPVAAPTSELVVYRSVASKETAVR